MRDRKVAYLGVGGAGRFPRFYITENGGAVWDGEEWTTGPGRPLLFADMVEASRAAEGLMRRQYADLPCVQSLTLPIHVEVRSKNGLDHYLLRDWLSGATTFTIGYGACGSGPVDDSLVLAHVNWLELRPVSEGE